jgi:hypothetical protein
MFFDAVNGRNPKYMSWLAPVTSGGASSDYARAARQPAAVR